MRVHLCVPNNLLVWCDCILSVTQATKWACLSPRMADWLPVRSVYAATELYMLTDYSPGYEDTWRALDRRLADVAAVGMLGVALHAAASHAAGSAAADVGPSPQAPEQTAQTDAKEHTVTGMHGRQQNQHAS